MLLFLVDALFVVTDLVSLTHTRPLRRKLRMRWFFDVSKVKESSLFKSDITGPPKIFDALLLENTNLSHSSFNFSVIFIWRSCFKEVGYIAYSNEWDWREKKTMFIHTNQPLINLFYTKKVPIFPELAMSQQ